MDQAKQGPYTYRWVILGVLWMTYLVVFLHRFSVGPLAPFFKKELDLTSAQTGWLVSAASLGYLASQFPVGTMVDKIGARWPIATGELIAGIFMIAMFFVPSYPWMLTLMFVTGIGCGFLQPATAHGVIIWFPLKERATIMGFKQTAVNLGGIISATTMPIVALALGWRYGFLFLGILSLIIATAAFILYRDPPVSAVSEVAGHEATEPSVSIGEVLKNREIWLVAFCAMGLAWVEIAMITHLVLYLTEALAFSVVTAGRILAMSEFAGAIGRPGSGLLSDRVFGGSRKKVWMLMAGTSSVFCLVLALFGPHLSWALYPVLFLLGLAVIAWGGLFLTLMAEFGGHGGTGKAVGLGTTVALCGAVIGPPFFGYIVDISGSYRLAWLSSAFISALCVVMLLFVSEEKRKI